ncbi:hypothetical protein [Actinomadura rupiterrae]|uniref:hypothetical protein n=1 Tax=Actinomadura rupiterrae TaxID=559627 RepID=UPI0020A31C64|nr:hypothetical protein [Actinomadura rupiterrae]MCP2335022.1 hypothetical protein [Actinomadura rupiterrae]
MTVEVGGAALQILLSALLGIGTCPTASARWTKTAKRGESPAPVRWREPLRLPGVEGARGE